MTSTDTTVPKPPPIPEWLTKDRDWYTRYAVAWNTIFSILALIAGISPILAWYASGAKGVPPTVNTPPVIQDPGLSWVGFWSLLAAISTTVNVILAPKSRADAGFAASNHLHEAESWFLETYLQPLSTDEWKQATPILRRAMRDARAIFWGKSDAPAPPPRGVLNVVTKAITKTQPPIDEPEN